jgi:predicted metalloendopeptidase
MVSRIKEAFIKKLKPSKWMDKEAVDLAVKKVENIKHKTGYPTAKVCLCKRSLKQVLTGLDIGYHQARVSG